MKFSKKVTKVTGSYQDNVLIPTLDLLSNIVEDGRLYRVEKYVGVSGNYQTVYYASAERDGINLRFEINSLTRYRELRRSEFKITYPISPVVIDTDNVSIEVAQRKKLFRKYVIVEVSSGDPASLHEQDVHEIYGDVKKGFNQLKNSLDNTKKKLEELLKQISRGLITAGFKKTYQGVVK